MLFLHSTQKCGVILLARMSAAIQTSNCLPEDQEDDSASVYSPSHLTHYLPIVKKQGLGGGLT